MEKQFFMVYAEGQGAPTYKHENEQAASKEAERLAEKLGVNTTVLQAVKQVAPKDITKRVKTYADACAVLGIEPMNEDVFTKLAIEVEFYASVNGRDVTLQLVSPGACQLLEDLRDRIIDEQVTRIRELAPEMAIIEQ